MKCFIILLLLEMATRFYLPSTGAAAVSPAYGSGWEDTSLATRLKCVTTRISSAMTSNVFTDSDATNKDILLHQFVSDPIAAQTISAQTVQIVLRLLQTLATNNMFLTWRVFVVSNDGSTERGDIVPIKRDGTEMSNVSLGSRHDTTTSTEVVASAGDRIVIEVGTGGDPDAGSDHDSRINVGDNSATDLPAGNGTTTADNPWVEFTNTLTFQSAGYTLIASQGSFALTGYATGLKVQRKLIAAQGSFTLTGFATNLLTTRKLTAEQGSFNLTGYDSNLLVGKKLSADFGSFALSGFAANLLTQRKLIAQQGSFVLTGNDASLLSGKKLSASVGSFALTGYDTSLKSDRRLVAGSGSFALTGFAAGLLGGKRILAGQGSFVLTGFNTSLYRSITITANAGSFILTGYSAGLRISKGLNAATGSFNLTGYSAALVRTRRLLAETGYFSLSGFTTQFIIEELRNFFWSKRMKYYKELNDDFNVPFTIRNDSGGIVDITSATITANFREDKTSLVNVFVKTSTDTNQIKKISNTNGIGAIYVKATNTYSLYRRNYFFEIVATIGSNIYKQQHILIFLQNDGTTRNVIPQQGTTAQRLALSLDSSNIGFPFYDTDDLTPYFWSGSAWT